jgi:anti-sigma factor RsiW
MTMIDRNDTEAISAYLDGNLAPRERERLETRLHQDQALRRELESLRRTRYLLKSAPQYRAPRNFTLTPEMAGELRAEKPGFMFGVSRLAFTLSTILFVVALVGNLSFRSLPGAQPEETTGFVEATEPAMESLDQSALPAEGDAAGAEEAMPMQAMEAESVPSGEEAGVESFDPATEESSTIVEESTQTQTQPVEDPVVEGTVTVEAVEETPVAGEASEPEVAAAPSDSDRTAAQSVPADSAPAPETGRINPWSIFIVLTGVAALLSGALALALRRK